jgi:hypothetical protein
MKASRIGTLVIACVVSVGVLAGQEKPAPAAQKEHTMTGCLQKGPAADTFVVTNTAGKGPKTISIIESKEPLTAHVGHKIDITGTDVPNAEAEAMKPTPPKGDHYMRVTTIKMVSATCP